MKAQLPYVIGTILSALIFISASYKFRWQERFWNIINKKIKPSYNGILFFCMLFFGQIMIITICDVIGISSVVSKFSHGVFMGFIVALAPYFMKK